MSGELVQTGTGLDLPKINMQLNTEDIIHLKIMQVEEGLKAKLAEAQERLRKTNEGNPYGTYSKMLTDTMRAQFSDVIKGLEELGVDVNLDEREDDEHDDELEFYLDDKKKKMYMRFHFTLNRKIPAKVLEAFEKQQNAQAEAQKITSEIYKIHEDLKNMPAVERKARANLAEWKLKKMGGQEMLDELLGTQS